MIEFKNFSDISNALQKYSLEQLIEIHNKMFDELGQPEYKVYYDLQSFLHWFRKNNPYNDQTVTELMKASFKGFNPDYYICMHQTSSGTDRIVSPSVLFLANSIKRYGRDIVYTCENLYA